MPILQKGLRRLTAWESVITTGLATQTLRRTTQFAIWRRKKRCFISCTPQVIWTSAWISSSPLLWTGQGSCSGLWHSILPARISIGCWSSSARRSRNSKTRKNHIAGRLWTVRRGWTSTNTPLLPVTQRIRSTAPGGTSNCSARSADWRYRNEAETQYW